MMGILFVLQNEEWVWNMDKLWSGGRLTLVGQEIKTMYLLENSW